jgi:hypothetical protein
MKYVITAANIPFRGQDGHSTLRIDSFEECMDIDGNKCIKFDPRKTDSKTFSGDYHQNKLPEVINIYPSPQFPNFCFFRLWYEERSRRCQPIVPGQKFYMQDKCIRRTKKIKTKTQLCSSSGVMQTQTWGITRLDYCAKNFA